MKMKNETSTNYLKLRCGVVLVSAKNTNKNRRSSMSYYVRRHSSVAVWVVVYRCYATVVMTTTWRHLYPPSRDTGSEHWASSFSSRCCSNLWS